MNILRINNKNIFLHLIFFIVILIGYITNPYHHDESLIEIILSNYNNFREFNFAFVDIELTFLRSYLFLLSLMPGEFSSPNNYLILRIPNLMIGTACIVIFVNILNSLYIKINWTSYPAIVLFAYYLLNFSGGLTIRPDIFVFFAVISSIYGYIKFQETNNIYYITIPFQISALLVSVHHLMIYPFFIGLLLILKYLKYFSKKSFVIFFVLSFLVAVLSLSLLLWGDSLKEFFVNLRSANLNFDGSIYKNILSEFLFLERAKHLFYFYPRLTLFLFPLSSLILISLIYKLLHKDKKFIIFYYIFISGIILLSLIPDKWLHHYAMLIPLILLLSIDSLKVVEIFFINKMSIIFNSVRYLIIIYCLVGLFFLITDLSRNIYYNNYLQINLNSLNKHLSLNLILNYNILESNEKLSLLNKKSKDKYFLMEPSIYPLMNNSKFSKRQYYENENLADYKLINIFKQNQCKDSNGYSYPSELLNKKFNDNGNKIYFGRDTYLICKIE
tara:strand:- start:1472 stop:2974 length:1503 start_codon:yes stop_codon:yes gene_type:complete